MPDRSAFIAPLLAGLIALLSPAPPAAAQELCHPYCEMLPTRPGPAGAEVHLQYLGANALLGGLTAGVRQWRGEGSFREGFLRGSLGGAGTYAGKWVAMSDVPAAGWTGRWIAAVGASVTRNASEGDPIFARLLLPLGPIRLHWRPAEREAHFSLDVATAGAFLVAHLSSMDVRIDWGRSLRSGTPVLLARDWEHAWGWHGRSSAGTMILRGDGARASSSSSFTGQDEFLRQVEAHERVHLIQYDQAWILWGEPMEERFMEWIGAGPELVRYADFSVHGLLFWGLGRLLPYDRQPWEHEAHAISGTDWDR